MVWSPPSVRILGVFEMEVLAATLPETTYIKYKYIRGTPSVLVQYDYRNEDDGITL